MTRLSFLAVLLAVAVAGCSTGATNTNNDLRGDLRLDAGALSPNATIVENAMTQPELSTLVAAIQRADLAGALSGDGPFTVFAPIDPAWEGMDLADADPEDLAATLQYHVVSGDVASTQLSDGLTLETLSGAELTVSTESVNDPMLMVDDADIVYPDIEASNGRIHLINLVLDPTRGGLAR